MASVKNMLAAGLLAAPCADAFVAPGISQVQGATLRGSAGVQSESCFGAKSALAAASAGAVALSFIGAQRPVARKQKVVCNFSKESQIGAMDPLGYFDPLDLCKDEATFKDFRAKEIKHGRLAMMGALGMLTQSLVQLPGFEGVPKDVSACTVGAGQTGFLITIAIIAVLEATVFVQDDSKELNPEPQSISSTHQPIWGSRGCKKEGLSNGLGFRSFSSTKQCFVCVFVGAGQLRQPPAAGG